MVQVDGSGKAVSGDRGEGEDWMDVASVRWLFGGKEGVGGSVG